MDMTEEQQPADPWAQDQPAVDQKKEPKRRPRKTVVVESPSGADQILEIKNDDGGVRGVYRRKWVEDDKSETGQAPIDVQILDCGLSIEFVVDTTDGKVIHCVVQRGKQLERATMAAEILEDSKKLNAWGTRVALCNWNIEDDTTRRLLKTWLLQQPGASRIVYCPGHSGYDSTHGVWLTDGVAIGHDGRSHMNVSGVSTGAIMCNDDREREFLVPSGGPVVRSFGLPLNTDWELKLIEARTTLKDLAEALNRNLGHHGGAIALGWLVSSLARDRFQNEHHAFPILYLHGPRHCGKNTLGEAMMRLTGQSAMPLKAGRGTSIVGLRDMSANSANIPLWFDELRNDDECAMYVAFVRGMFDGSTQVIGNAKDPGKNRVFTPKRTLMCSGQSLLGRDAEHSRYVVVELSPHSIRRSEWPGVSSLLDKAHQAYWRMAAIRRTWVDNLSWLTEHYTNILRAKTDGHDVMDRQLYCWAVVCAGLATATMVNPLHTIGMANATGDKDPLGDEFIDEVVRRMVHSQDIRHEDSAISSFWSVAETLHAQGKCSSDLWMHPIVDMSEASPVVNVGIWVDFLINNVQREGRLGSTIEKRLLYTELAAEDGWVANSRNVRINNSVRRCSVFTLGSTALPPWVRELAIKKLPSSAAAVAQQQLSGQTPMFNDEKVNR